MCSAQVSMHHAARRIKIELTSFGERTSSQIPHLQQLPADPPMKRHEKLQSKPSGLSPCSNVLCGNEWNSAKIICGEIKDLKKALNYGGYECHRSTRDKSVRFLQVKAV
ncbi:hypothetical protein NQZ68_016136 [Dissostichus eleginoides]|nr:hypothetical protein NQZ68_016136 [Dissostichus eleginoides]